MSVIDELTTYILRPENRHNDLEVSERKRTLRTSDLGINRKYGRSGVCSSSESRTISPSADTSSVFPFSDTSVANSTTTIGYETPTSSACDLSGNDKIRPHSNPSQIANPFDFDEKQTEWLFDESSPNDTNSLRGSESFVSGRPFDLAVTASTLNPTSPIKGLYQNFTVNSSEVARGRIPTSNHDPVGKDEWWERLEESLSSDDVSLSQRRLADDIWLQFDGTINKSTVDVQTTPAYGVASQKCSESFSFDNLDGYPAATSCDFMKLTWTTPTRSRNHTTNSIDVASTRNEDTRFLGITGVYKESSPSGLCFRHSKVNNANVVSPFESLPLSTGTVAFDVVHCPSIGVGTIGTTVAPCYDSVLTEPLSHMWEPDNFPTCTALGNAYVNRCRYIRQPSRLSMLAEGVSVVTEAYFQNEDVAELFQAIGQNDLYQAETVDNLLATNSLVSQSATACQTNRLEHYTESDFSEWNPTSGAVVDNTVSLSNVRLNCAHNFPSDTTPSRISFPNTSKSIRDNWHMIEAWDASLEHICDCNKISDFNCPSTGCQNMSSSRKVCGIDDTGESDRRCTPENWFPFTFGDVTIRARNNHESVTNLSDLENTSDCFMTGALKVNDPKTFPDPTVHEAAACHRVSQTGYNSKLCHRNPSVTVVQECTCGEYSGRCLSANNGITKYIDDDVLMAGVVSDNSISKRKLPSRVVDSDHRFTEYDYSVDKCVNEALDLLLSIMEAQPTTDREINTL